GCPGWGGADQGCRPVERKRLLDEVIGANAAFHKAEVSGAFLNGSCHFGRVAGDEIDRDARVRPAKADQPQRQPIAGDGLARINCESTALETSDLRQGELRRPGARQDGPCLIEKQTPRIRELDPPTDPTKQRDCMALLERRDRGAYRGLGEVEGLGGARYVFALSDSLKNSKLLERHRTTP